MKKHINGIRNILISNILMAISILLICSKMKPGIATGEFNIMDYIIPAFLMGISIFLVKREENYNE